MQNDHLNIAAEALQAAGYSVRRFETGQDAADYLDHQIDGKSVGFGGSMSLEEMGLWERLRSHNQVYSHLHGTPAGKEAAFSQIYISSVNGLAETGEMILIDGYGNRAAAVLFGHEKVYLVIGSNKLAPSYEEAVWRTRNIAAPKNAKRKSMKTPCVNKGVCCNCSSPERICRAMVTLWQPIMGMETEVLLIREPLGY